MRCYTLVAFDSESSPGVAPSFTPRTARLHSSPLVCCHVTPFREDLMSTTKLYVGNLSYETSEASLRRLFERHGDVASVTVMIDRASGRSRGFAFVEMGTAEQAQAAKSALDGAQLDGRSLKLDEARELQPGAPRPRGSYGRGEGRW